MAEIINSYETVIVVSAAKGEETNTTLVERFKALIAENGTVESVDDWGKRRLAYPINKETEAYYTLINFKADSQFTAELDRRYKITDGILRTLIVKKDPRYLNSNKPVKVAPAKTIDVEAVAEEAVATETVTTEETKAE